MWNESLGSRPHRAASTPKAIELRVVLESYVKVRLLSQCGNLGYFSSVPEAVVSRLLIVDSPTVLVLQGDHRIQVL
jgi:hypothetical protein